MDVKILILNQRVYSYSQVLENSTDVYEARHFVRPSGSWAGKIQINNDNMNMYKNASQN
jgi:hypothetical protein